MIMRKENVVRYVVEIDAEKKFEDDFGVMFYVEELLKREMPNEYEKMRKRGWNMRFVKEDPYLHTNTYYVEYVTKTTY